MCVCVFVINLLRPSLYNNIKMKRLILVLIGLGIEFHIYVHILFLLEEIKLVTTRIDSLEVHWTLF